MIVFKDENVNPYSKTTQDLELVRQEMNAKFSIVVPIGGWPLAARGPARHVQHHDRRFCGRRIPANAGSRRPGACHPPAEPLSGAVCSQFAIQFSE